MSAISWPCQAEDCGATFPKQHQRQSHCKDHENETNHAAAYWYCPFEGCPYSRQAQEEDGRRSRQDAMLSHLVTLQHNIESPDGDKKNGKPLPMPIRVKLLESAVALTDAALAMKAGDVNTHITKSAEAHARWSEATNMIADEKAAMRAARNAIPTGQHNAMLMQQQNAMPVQQQHTMDMQQYHGTFAQQQRMISQQQYATNMQKNATGMQQQTVMSAEEQTEGAGDRIFLIIYFTAVTVNIRHRETPAYLLSRFEFHGGEEGIGAPVGVWQLDSDSGCEVEVDVSSLPAPEHWRGCWLSTEEFQDICSTLDFTHRRDTVKRLSLEKREKVHPPV